MELSANSQAYLCLSIMAWNAFKLQKETSALQFCSEKSAVGIPIFGSSPNLAPLH